MWYRSERLSTCRTRENGQAESACDLDEKQQRETKDRRRQRTFSIDRLRRFVRQRRRIEILIVSVHPPSGRLRVTALDKHENQSELRCLSTAQCISRARHTRPQRRTRKMVFGVWSQKRKEMTTTQRQTYAARRAPCKATERVMRGYLSGALEVILPRGKWYCKLVVDRCYKLGEVKTSSARCLVCAHEKKFHEIQFSRFVDQNTV